MQIKKLITVFIITAALVPIFTASAQQQEINPGTLYEKQETLLEKIGIKSGLGHAGPVSDSTIAQKIGLGVGIVLGFLGVAFLALIFYSGFQWLTAGGNDENIAKARKRMVQALIGLAIAVSAFGLSMLVINSLEQNLTDTPAEQTE